MLQDLTPLTGVRVLDLSRLLPGPYCTMLLAQMGAEIVKVEGPEAPDYLRFVPPAAGSVSALFQAVNRGKRSLAVNLKRAEGRDLLLELLPHFDVFVEGFRPGVMERLGLGDEVLAAANERLIRVSVSSWGAESPWAHKAGHDLNFCSMAGLLNCST